jgi:hypothetical protein
VSVERREPSGRWIVFRVLKVSHPRVTAVVAVLGLALAFSSAASAGGPPYTVKVKVVPSTVRLTKTFKVIASGRSANASRLIVFLNRVRKCALTVAGDAAIPSNHLLVKTGVVHLYSDATTVKTLIAGKHYVCAYLTALPPSTLLRARAGAAYKVG